MIIVLKSFIFVIVLNPYHLVDYILTFAATTVPFLFVLKSFAILNHKQKNTKWCLPVIDIVFSTVLYYMSYDEDYWSLAIYLNHKYIKLSELRVVWIVHQSLSQELPLTPAGVCWSQFGRVYIVSIIIACGSYSITKNFAFWIKFSEYFTVHCWYFAGGADKTAETAMMENFSQKEWFMLFTRHVNIWVLLCDIVVWPVVF